MYSFLSAKQLLYILFIFVSPYVFAQTMRANLDLERISTVADSLAAAHMATGLIPGMSIALAKDGKVFFSKGYGKADVEMDVAAGSQTIYKIGSITKQMTAAIMMRLVEKGKISLEDPITKYLPDYPLQGHQVTLRHLLNHTSGIKGFRVLQEENRQRFRLDLSYAEMVGLFGTQPFEFKPGEKYAYNNMGYYLLGEIITKATGTPWKQYVEEELLKPLGLNQTLYCEESRIIPHRAQGYEYEAGKLVNARYLSMQVGGAAGALCSSVSDLIRWTHLLHSGQVVSLASLEQMITPTVLAKGDTIGYGYGLQLGEWAGHFQVFHGGGANGFISGLMHYPKEGVTIVILTNSGKANPHLLAKEIARVALPIKLLDLPLRAKDIARYQGSYTYQSGRRTHPLRVFGENGVLKAQFEGGRAFRLLYQGNHVFIPIVDDDDRLVFTMEKGRAKGFLHHEGRWEVIAAKRKL